MTWEHVWSFPRHDLPEVLQFHWPSENRGRRERRAPTAPASPCPMGRKENAHGFDRYSQDIPAFPAQWVDGLYVLSPVSGLDCHRCRSPKRRDRIDATVAAPGPHDFTVRCGVFARRAEPA